MPLFDLDVISSGLTAAALVEPLGVALGAGTEAVVQAPPGSGKTTIVPPLVANLVEARTAGRVLVTQPRRVAVRAAARRLAELDGSRLGERVGYSVRGDRSVSGATVVEFVTPGLLLRRLLQDPELDGVAAVVIDEVHERQLDTDLLLALLGDVRQLREELVLVAMSATLDAGRFAALLGTEEEPAPIVDSPAALHPLEVRWAPYAASRTDERGVARGFLDHVAHAAHRAHAAALSTVPGTDALVFLPGAREVAQVAQRLRELAPGTEVLELHGRIEPAEQDRAVRGREVGGAPRIVVSTALAESSLTVPGVRLVIDAGLSREPRRDAARGMSGLVTVTSSRATCEQRAGRAARLGPGVVVRCYDERTLAAAPAHVAPEILISDLTDAALTLAAWGTPGGHGLRWVDQPPPGAMAEAQATLFALDAVDTDGRVTPSGERLAQIPSEPRWGRALLDGAATFGARPVAEVVAAATGDVRPRGGDLAAAVRDLRSGSHPASGAWRRDLQRLEKVVGRTDGPQGAGNVVAQVIALAWPERLARLVAERTYLLAQGTRAALPEDSALVGAQWLAIAEVARAEGRVAAGTGAVIRSAAAISEAEAGQVGEPLLVTEQTADLSSGKVQGRRVRRLGAIELASTPIKLDRASAADAVARALQGSGWSLLNWTGTADRLRRRMAFAHQHLAQPWPSMAQASLQERWQEWLAPEVRRIAEGTPVGRIDLTDPLRRLMPWPAAADFNELVPDRLLVPSGNTAAVHYPEVEPDGQVSGPPVVEVKLQETFGLAASPRIAGVAVQFHLLSPAGRPLAVTDDLASFWNGPYTQVRAEMRGRYPKHPWPEDPWSATATHLTSKRAGGR